MDVNNIKQVLIACDCGRTANVQIHDSSNATTYIGKGEIVITDPQGNVLSTTTATKAIEYITIVQRSASGDEIYQSAPIYGKFLRSYTGKLYAAEAEQVTAIGFDGTSGALTANLAVNTHYFIELNSRENPILGINQAKSFGYRSSSVTAPTQIDVATGIAKRMGYDLLGSGNFNVKAEVLSDNAGAAITGTGDLLVSQGVDVISVTDADAVFAVGDYIRIGGTATTNSVYRVEGIDAISNLITLDRPYQGVSATIAEASNEKIAKADAEAGNAGIIITALPFYYETFNFPFTKENVDVSVGENILVTPVEKVLSSKGTGTYKEVADVEAANKGYFYTARELTHPRKVIEPAVDTQSTETYDLVNLGFSWKRDNDIANATNHQGDVLLAIANGTNQGAGGTTTIIEVLNKYCVTEWGVGIAITLT